MQMSLKIASGLAAGAALSLALTFAIGQSPTPVSVGAARYSVQFSPAKAGPIYFIADNATETLHVYENGPEGCLLKQSIDLSQVGQRELIAIQPERLVGKEPAVQTKQR